MPKMSPKQLEAINTIDEDVEIIACAGAGKTGVVTRRIVNILKKKTSVTPENIVAFTFTKKAAEELKNRIYQIGEEELGNTHGFANMYIGTIHGFCLQMLKENIPKFQSFSVLDDVHAKLFVERYYDEIGMTDLGLQRYIETDLFISAISLLNENWEDSTKWDEPTRTAFTKYQKKVYEEHYFDYSLILREMVYQLEHNTEFRDLLQKRVKYLTVDEYQDTNPIQEKLISLLKGLGCNLCVVGDDDQTIYQFRGSDSTNILTFVQRYGIKKYIVLDTDYRSTEGIISVARTVISNNFHRLKKEMKSGCPTPYDQGDITFHEYDYAEEEYDSIAQSIVKLHDIGIPYSEMAVLLRKRKIGPEIADALAEYSIPFVIEGMNSLMQTAECRAASSIFSYLNGDIEAQEVYQNWLNIDYPFDKKELADSLQVLMVIDVAKLKYYQELNLQEIYHEFGFDTSTCCLISELSERLSIPFARLIEQCFDMAISYAQDTDYQEYQTEEMIDQMDELMIQSDDELKELCNYYGCKWYDLTFMQVRLYQLGIDTEEELEKMWKYYDCKWGPGDPYPLTREMVQEYRKKHESQS